MQEPKWSGVPRGEYSFEVLKGGVIVETVPLNRPFIVIGRQSQCDVVLEHPSLSRYLAIYLTFFSQQEWNMKTGFFFFFTACF